MYWKTFHYFAILLLVFLQKLPSFAIGSPKLSWELTLQTHPQPSSLRLGGRSGDPCLLFWVMSVVRRSTINEESFTLRCSREVPPNDKNKKTIERNKTQDLMRFDKLPTSSEQERESFIDSITNTIFYHTIEEDSAPLFIAKETQKIWKPQLDSFPIQKRNPKSRRIRLSIDRPVDRPKSRSTERSTAPTREQSHVSRSTVRSTGRLTVIACARWCTPVDRPVDR